MQSKASTVEEYLEELSEERREAIQAIRQAILKNLPRGYEEGMQYGMIGYFVPHSLYPAGYHCDPKQPLPFASLASQKNHMALYIGFDDDFEIWLREAWTKTGKKFDRGRACIRFKKLDDVPLSIVGQAIKRIPVKKYIAHYEAVINTKLKRPPKKKKAVRKKTSKAKGA
jgi:hypothetical protein